MDQRLVSLQAGLNIKNFMYKISVVIVKHSNWNGKIHLLITSEMPKFYNI